MESSRSTLAPVALVTCLLALSAGFVSLNENKAKRGISRGEEAQPAPVKPAEKLKPKHDPWDPGSNTVPNAPLAPVATGLAQRTITMLAIKTIAFSPNGKLVAVGGADGTVRVWEFSQQTLWHAEQVHAGWLFDLQFHPDGQSLITGGGDNAIKIWSFGQEWKARLLNGHTDDLHGVAFTPDGKRVVSGSDDTTVRVWDLKTGKDQIVGQHDRQVTDVAVHPEGHLAASSSRDGTIRLWDLDTLKPAGVLKGHTADVLAIAFSHDGKQLASASYDKSVKVWDVASRQPVHTFQKHNDWVFCVAFSTDGKRLASGGGDRRVLVWDLGTGELQQEIAHQTDVSAVAFSPDGKHFVAGLIDGYLQLYRTGEKQLEHFGVIPPAGWTPMLPGAGTEPLALREFLNLHTDLSTPQSKTWDASVGKLTVSGDGFTLLLLEKINPEALPPTQREMWTRARETLQLRAQQESANNRFKLLEHRIRRAAQAELQRAKFQAELKSWTFDIIGPEMIYPHIRQELERIRSVNDEPTVDKTSSADLDKRVHAIVDELFKRFPEEQPAAGPEDPTKSEEETRPEQPALEDL